MQHMALLFKKHCSDFWKNGRSLPKTAKKYSWIPRRLVTSSMNQQDPSMSFLVERLLDQTILGTAYSVQERARCLAGVFASFDAKSQVQLTKLIISNKKRVQETVKSLLDIAEELKHSDSDGLKMQWDLRLDIMTRGADPSSPLLSKLPYNPRFEIEPVLALFSFSLLVSSQISSA